MLRIKLLLLVILIMTLSASACSAPSTQIQLTMAPTQTLQPVLTQSVSNVPLSEAEVPRVSIEEAKAALDRGEAIIVDVRSPDAYAASHVAGAINIQLGDIETNSTALNLDKYQWIITYCT